MYHISLHNFTPLFWLLVEIYISENEYSWSDKSHFSNRHISIWQWCSSSWEGHIPLIYFRVYSSLMKCGYYSDSESVARRKESAAEAAESKEKNLTMLRCLFKLETVDPLSMVYTENVFSRFDMSSVKPQKRFLSPLFKCSSVRGNILHLKNVGNNE